MADLIWNWVSKGWRSMEDLADKIDDLICTFEGGESTMDTVAMYVFGWMLLGLVVVGVGRFAYGKFIKKTDKIEPASEKPAPQVKPEPVVDPPKEIPKVAPKPVSAAPAGRYVPPTPPTRKRLGSRSGSGGPVVRPKQNLTIHPPPTATGPETESVKWVNELFYWLYSDLVVVNELLSVWILSLNEFTKKSVSEHGVGVEFVRVLPETPPPNISNVFCECASNDDVTITCDCETTPALQLKVFRQKGEKVEVSHYRLNVNRFRARLNIVAVTEKLLADIKCDGWPEVKVSLAQVGSIKNNLDENQLQDVINEIVTGALRNSHVNCNLSQYPTCPRLSRYVPTPGPLLPVHYDSIIPGHNKTANKRLLIKVIKAQGLGSSQGCSEAFCVVEVDEPPQKNQTTVKKNTSNPVWDEHFLFDVNNLTSEILLEIHDKTPSGNKFMGLGIVSMDELMTTPSQRQIISLQSTPVHDTPVSGNLTVEFMMIEGADLPITGDKPFKIKETLRSVSPSGQMLMKTRTTLTNDQMTNGGEEITDSALRELERSRGSTQPNKSTLIIHSVQRSPPPDNQQTLKVELSDTGMWLEVPDSKQGMNAPSPVGLNDTNQEPNGTERGRSRRKKRDFFGTLRRRLNRSKTRSKSAGPGDYDGDVDPMARSISADRGRDPSAHSTDKPNKELHQSDTLSPLPAIFSYLTVPGLREGSERSSLSEASGISGASSRTYVNEASTLVLETLENGIYKYYLVPLSIAQRSKWKKKGTKLHIFNDHTFIAKHLSGGTICQVCKKGLPRRLGKQGYECRDCQFKCHKHCHVKVDTTCPNSNIHSLELCSTAQSPYTSRKNQNTS